MMPEQEQLLEKARESVKASRTLIKEGMHCFAISRSYYAMFYAAQALLLNKGLSFSKHSAVISAFGQHFIKTGLLPKKLHQDIIMAEEDRLKADYDIQIVNNPDTSDYWVQCADNFIAQIEIFLKQN